MPLVMPLACGSEGEGARGRGRKKRKGGGEQIGVACCVAVLPCTSWRGVLRLLSHYRGDAAGHGMREEGGEKELNGTASRWWLVDVRRAPSLTRRAACGKSSVGVPRRSVTSARYITVFCTTFDPTLTRPSRLSCSAQTRHLTSYNKHGHQDGSDVKSKAVAVVVVKVLVEVVMVAVVAVTTRGSGGSFRGSSLSFPCLSLVGRRASPGARDQLIQVLRHLSERLLLRCSAAGSSPSWLRAHRPAACLCLHRLAPLIVLIREF
ncbi:hypothetical protein O3P69_011627 [Scylla paramamosain]|uniref:Uncharacterized protein n=1 Tax=Scylla paramamosain TaxID=85552 RepID=A0AAW0T7R2_SCYPA